MIEGDARLDVLAVATGQAVIGMDAEGRITEWAGQAREILGWEPDEVIGRDLADVVIPAFYRAAHRHGVARYRLGGGGGRVVGVPIELPALRRDGTEVPVEMVVIPQQRDGGDLHFTAVLRDVTERVRTERLAAMQLAVGQLLLGGAALDGAIPEVLATLGDTLRCAVVLSFAQDLSGELRLEHHWHTGDPGLDAFCARAAAAPLPQAELVGRMLRGGAPFVVHAGMEHHNPLLVLAGEVGLRWMAVFPIANPERQQRLLVLLSVEMLALDAPLLRAMGNVGGQLGQAYARDEAERRLWHQAFHDQLTGLANRALFIDRLEHALRRAVRHGSTCAVLLLDLDDFKRVNDTRGHLVGDRLVRAVAARLCEHLRLEDSVARLGGDEFAVLLEDVDPGAAEVAAERMIAALLHPFRIDGRELLVSTSVGVALSGDANGSDEIMRGADLAMYVAKSRGKGRYQRFEQSMLSAMVERVTLEQEIRTALAREQFAVLYQPQMDIATGRIVAAEALVRWSHPTRGWLEPGAFVPHAEESPLITALGAWVLRTACVAAQRWSERGLGRLRVAVNLSGRELESPDLQERVRGVLDETGLPASSLELEITETAAVVQHEDALERLSTLRGLGVGIAIDDFGTGYSMLSRLQEFPLDRLKIDRSFIGTIDLATDVAPLVAAMIAMAHGLGLRVVAEGVEVPEQLHYLRAHGCDEAQGYLVGRPLSAAAFEELLLRSADGAAELRWEEPDLEPHRLLGDLVEAEPEADRLVPALLLELRRLTGVPCRLLAPAPEPPEQAVPVTAPDGRLVGWLGGGAGADGRTLEVMRVFSRVIAAQMA